ncbi:MAG: ACT domain-containing protein, partial [Elainella sp.]
VMFFGPGAGSGPTASAVVADILNIAAILKVGRDTVMRADGTPLLDPLLACSHQDYCDIAPIEELITRFYVRFLAKDSPGVIGTLGTCFGKHAVSLESVVQIGMRDSMAEIVVITHDVREGNFRQALEEIRQFDTFAQIPSVLRVL